MRKAFSIWFWFTIACTIYSYHLHQNPDYVAISWHEAFANAVAGEIIFSFAALTAFAPFTWPILGILFFARSRRMFDNVDEHLEHNLHKQMHHHKHAHKHAFNHKMHISKSKR